MKKGKNSINETLKELLIGIIVYGILIEAVFIWFVKEKLYFTCGLWVGVLLAVLAALHMWKSLDTGMDLGEKASKYVVTQNLVRYGVIVIAFGVLCIWDFGNPIAAFAGIMGLKAGAYLQPFTHKLRLKLQRR